MTISSLPCDLLLYTNHCAGENEQDVVVYVRLLRMKPHECRLPPLFRIVGGLARISWLARRQIILTNDTMFFHHIVILEITIYLFLFVPKHAFVTLAMQDDFFHQPGRHSHIIHFLPKYFDYMYIVTSIVDRGHREWSLLPNI